MSCFINVQDKLDACLQRDVEIKLGDKTIRRGSFILYTIKDYYLTVILKTPTSNKTYDILYPFDIDISDDQIVFNYKTEHLVSDHKIKSREQISKTTSCSSHKFLNKILTLNFI